MTTKENMRRARAGLIFAASVAAVVGALFWLAEAPLAKFNHRTNTVVVYADSGGTFMDYLAKFEEMRATGKTYRVEGVCASACTYFMNILPPEDVCAGPRALFGFHGVYSGYTGFLREDTLFWHARVYPAKVLKLLADRGFDGTKDVDTKVHPTGTIWMDRDTLGIQHCPN